MKYTLSNKSYRTNVIVTAVHRCCMTFGCVLGDTQRTTQNIYHTLFVISADKGFVNE